VKVLRVLLNDDAQFSLAWWLFIDAGATGHIKGAYYAPGILSTVALFMFVCLCTLLSPRVGYILCFI
jgi:hypothetical protein